MPGHEPEPESNHEHKSSTLRCAKWPEDSIDENDLWVIVCMMMHMDVYPLPNVPNHWCTHAHCNLFLFRASVT